MKIIKNPAQNLTMNLSLQIRRDSRQRGGRGAFLGTSIGSPAATARYPKGRPRVRPEGSSGARERRRRSDSTKRSGHGGRAQKAGRGSSDIPERTRGQGEFYRRTKF